jgi:hypothetical protein
MSETRERESSQKKKKKFSFFFFFFSQSFTISSCPCGPRGSCSASGECICLPGYTGKLCTLCGPRFYRVTPTRCASRRTLALGLSLLFICLAILFLLFYLRRRLRARKGAKARKKKGFVVEMREGKGRIVPIERQGGHSEEEEGEEGVDEGSARDGQEYEYDYEYVSDLEAVLEEGEGSSGTQI